MSGKELFIRFTARAFRRLLSVYVFSYFTFAFEGRMWDVIVSVPDHCLSFYFLSQSLDFWMIIKAFCHKFSQLVKTSPNTSAIHVLPFLSHLSHLLLARLRHKSVRSVHLSTIRPKH